MIISEPITTPDISAVDKADDCGGVSMWQWISVNMSVCLSVEHEEKENLPMVIKYKHEHYAQILRLIPTPVYPPTHLTKNLISITDHPHTYLIKRHLTLTLVMATHAPTHHSFK